MDTGDGMNGQETGKDVEGDVIVDCLGSAIYHGETNLGEVPGLLRRVLEEGFWRRRVLRKTGQIVEFPKFMDFVKEKPPEGLGTDLRTLQRLCQDDKVTLDLLDRETAQGPGAPEGNQNAAESKTIDSNRNGCFDENAKRPVGTTAAYALRRLRSSRPDLHERVLANDLSPNAAMIEAGFRQKTITIPVEPTAAARRIRNNFTDEQVAELIALLIER